MQRVRIGLTGLGFVFIVVLLATALTGSPEGQAPATNTIANAEGNKAAPQEPLAELGVTPGNADANGARATLNQAHQVAR
jgi:hypothetical protein